MSKKFLYDMIEEISVSGNEFDLQKKIIEYMENYVDQCSKDHVGNVISIVNPDADFKVMLAAHSDEIGLTITRVMEDGRCMVDAVGSITPAVYIGQRVQVKTANGIVYGVIAKPRGKDVIQDSDLILDIGAYSKQEALQKVAIGDVIVHDYTYRELNEHNIAARALDDKIGIYCISLAAIKAKALGVKLGIYSTTTVGEETTKNGAMFSARAINPNVSISVDVGSDTSIKDNLSNSSYTHLGMGPIITTGVTINPVLIDIVKKIASENNIPLQFNTNTGRTYTDLDAIHYVGKGVPSILISIPLRYMHSPAEVADMRDVENAIELIVKILQYLDNNQPLNFTL